MDNTWLTQAKRLQAIASTGLHFCRDEYDRERYQEIADIAHRMLAELGGVPPARILELVSDFAQGYATPKVDVRGALIEHGRILLVREKSDGCWTLPGGYADVGLSPAERDQEIREEAGIAVSATRLYSVRHKAKREYEPDVRDFYKLFFLCARDGDERTPTPGLERWMPTSSRPTGCRRCRGAGWWKAISRRHSRSGPTKQERRRSTKTDMRQCARRPDRAARRFPCRPPSSELHSAVLMDAPARQRSAPPAPGPPARPAWR